MKQVTIATLALLSLPLVLIIILQTTGIPIEENRQFNFNNPLFHQTIKYHETIISEDCGFYFQRNDGTIQGVYEDLINCMENHLDNCTPGKALYDIETYNGGRKVSSARINPDCTITNTIIRVNEEGELMNNTRNCLRSDITDFIAPEIYCFYESR